MSSIIKVDQIQLADGSTPTAGDLGLNTTGSVLQTAQQVYSGVGSITSYAWVTIASLDITLKGDNSSLLISSMIPFGAAGAEPFHLKLTVDGVQVGAGNAASFRTQATSSASVVSSNRIVILEGKYLHPTTFTAGQTKTITMQVNGQSGTTYYVNRTGGDSDTAFYPRTISTLIVQEIAG